jgi:hypothetical protein
MQQPPANRDTVLFFLGGALAVILILLPITNRWVTLALLVCLAGLLIHPVLQLPVVRSADSRKAKIVRSVLASVLLLVVLILFGRIVWPPPKYLALTDGQRTKFIQVLQEISGPQQNIRVGCSANEDVCTSAAEFIDLFQKGKWKVRGNQIERGFLGRPQAGVTILLHGEGTIPDPDDPKWGLWTPAIDPERDCIVKAFSTAGIVPHRPMASSQVNAGEIAVIFGPAPH